MWINWKRFTLGALLLTSLSLFLFGCSDFGGSSSTPTTPVTKAISGIVQDANGQPVSATITASAIDTTSGTVVSKATQLTAVQANSVGKSTQKPLNISPCQSNGAGRYTLYIPKSYGNLILLTATPIAGGPAVRTIVVQPSSDDQSNIVITIATEYLVSYIESVLNGGFTTGNVTSATHFLEQVFVPSFLSVPLSTTGNATDLGALLLVRITAILSLSDHSPTTLFGSGANLGTTLLSINNAITDPAFQIPSLVSPAQLAADTVPPTAPLNFTAPSNSITINSITLTWDASTDKNPDGSDGSGVVAYYLYRNGAATPIAIIPASAARTYTDTALASLTTYTYTITARDAAGNFSAASTTSATTNTTHTISGTISQNGAGLLGITVTITGNGIGTTTTDSNGKYTFTGVRPGIYVITPTRPANATFDTFTPVSTQVTVSNADVTADFMAVQFGAVTGTVTNPDGSVTVTTTYPDGTVTAVTTYPNGTVTTVTTYPNGTAVVTTTYPNGTVIVTTTTPNGTVTVTTTYSDGSISTTTTTADGSVAGTLIYSDTSRATANTL